MYVAYSTRYMAYTYGMTSFPDKDGALRVR